MKSKEGKTVWLFQLLVKNKHKNKLCLFKLHKIKLIKTQKLNMIKNNKILNWDLFWILNNLMLIVLEIKQY